MEKNEKLKKVQAFISSLGLTAEEVIAYLGKASVESEETGDASVQSEEVVSADVVCPGMYYYSDRTISADILSDKQLSGVVGWVDDSGRHGLVLGLREVRLPWSSDYLVVNLPENADGKENTRLILEVELAEAAKWCVEYDFDGVQFGEAFLASREEWVKIFRNLGAIQEALEKISRCLLKEDYWYWSSSEYDYYDAWAVRPFDGYMSSNSGKLYKYRVRCVWKF